MQNCWLLFDRTARPFFGLMPFMDTKQRDIWYILYLPSSSLLYAVTIVHAANPNHDKLSKTGLLFGFIVQNSKRMDDQTEKCADIFNILFTCSYVGHMRSASPSLVIMPSIKWMTLPALHILLDRFAFFFCSLLLCCAVCVCWTHF